MKDESYEMGTQNEIETTSESDRNSEIEATIFPRWATISFLILCGGVLMVFVILTFVVPKPTVHYGEKCGNRLCSSDLICSSGKCDCKSSEYFFSKECQRKKLFLEKCHNQSAPCDENLGLKCSDGVCKCDDLSIWKRDYCQPKHSYYELCEISDDECITTSLLYCNKSTKKCLCKENR